MCFDAQRMAPSASALFLARRLANMLFVLVVEACWRLCSSFSYNCMRWGTCGCCCW